MRTEMTVAPAAAPDDVANTSNASSPSASTTAAARLTRRARNALLSAHIAVSVALLGDVLALAAVTLKAMDADDPVAARAYHEVMSTFSLVFGIPLSFGALLTGLALGWGTRWGIVRYRWVIAKLGLILAVIVVGALVIGPAETRLLDEPLSASTRNRAESIVFVGAMFDVAALLVAVGLSVFKPGRQRRPRSSAPDPAGRAGGLTCPNGQHDDNDGEPFRRSWPGERWLAAQGPSPAVSSATCSASATTATKPWRRS